MATTIKLTSKRQATFPVELCDDLGVQAGDEIELQPRIEKGEHLWVLRKVEDPARPWLGIYAEEARGYLFISRVAEDGPAAQAGLSADEIIVRVAGEPVSGLSEFYQRLWSVGEAGVTVPLTVLRDGELTEVSVISDDRYNWLKLNPSF